MIWRKARRGAFAVTPARKHELIVSLLGLYNLVVQKISGETLIPYTKYHLNPEDLHNKGINSKVGLTFFPLGCL